jgi:hypothetical protein
LFQAVKFFLWGGVEFSRVTWREIGHMPITLIAIHGNVVLARVGLQEEYRGILRTAAERALTRSKSLKNQEKEV